MIHKIKGMLWVVLFFVACLLMLPMTAFADTPISRNTDEVSKGRYKVYVNPVNYEVSKGKFAKIDPASTTSTATTLSRNKGVVKALFRDRQVTFSPDEGQWSLVVRAGTQTLTGGPIGMSLASKPVVDPTYPDRTQMDGNKFEVSTTSKGSKFLIPSTSSVTDFSCQFILTPSKGLELIHKDGNVWFEYKGKWVLGIGEPQLLNTKTLEPLDGETLPPKDLVDFTLVDNGHGTWTYTKIPGKDFAKLKKPATYWIDANITFTSDFARLYGTENNVWANCRNSTDARDIYASPSWMGVYSGKNGIAYYIARMPVFFDMSSLAGTVTAVTQYLYGEASPLPLEDTGFVSAQLGTFSAPIAKADFNNMSLDSGEYGHTTGAWNTTGWNSFAYNATGIAGVQTHVDAGITIPIMLRDYGKDYSDVAPINKMYTAIDYGPGKDPYLEITITPPAPIIRSPWRGFTSWEDNGFSIWP